METIDDNPGVGRTLDKYFFQPLGRRVERFAMRISIASLPPWRISQYFASDLLMEGFGLPDPQSIDRALALLNRRKGGSTIVAGLKSLVKQTQ